MSGIKQRNINLPKGVEKLKEEHRKAVKSCDGQIEHWRKVERDYDALLDRLKTLPDKLSYDIMVPFGPLAFMPGKLVHTNELTVLLGDNWFARCTAKEAQALVEHRKTHVRNALDDLHRVVKNIEGRAVFTDDLEKLAGGKGDFVDIREEAGRKEILTKGKQRLAHKPHSKPKEEYIVELEEEEEEGGGEDGGSSKGVLSEEELWARLDELEKLEEEQDNRDRACDAGDSNGEDSTSSSSSEEEREQEREQEGGPERSVAADGHRPGENAMTTARPDPVIGMNGEHGPHNEEEEEEVDEDSNGLPTIYFSHTVEPKKVRINTGKNTTLKFSERKEQKEQAKKKKKSGTTNGHEQYKIITPADLYRLFVDVVNGEPIPRKSILKSRSRENSVCSDTSESSTADLEERRGVFGRSISHDDTTHSDTSDGITEEDSPTGAPSHRSEAFSGMVVEKDPLPLSIPHLSIAPPALPTIPERKQEELVQEPPQEPPKRVSKFKAARLQQK